MKFISQTNFKDPQALEALKRMEEQIKKVGGELHFVMETDEEGWFSVCKEFPAIVTGGPSLNPSEEEVFRLTIESIKTAFDVPITDTSLVKEKKAEKALIRISTIMTKEFCFA